MPLLMYKSHTLPYSCERFSIVHFQFSRVNPQYSSHKTLADETVADMAVIYWLRIRWLQCAQAVSINLLKSTSLGENS